MPQRFLRPGITTSDRWNAVSFIAQSFYVRLLTLVDDYGRYDGRIAILHAQCFALRPDINPQDSAAARRELQTANLIEIYEVGGKEYVQITKWQERARGPSKYPSNPNPQDSAAERSGAQPNPASLALAIVPSPSHESSPSSPPLATAGVKIPPEPPSAPDGRFYPTVEHALGWLVSVQKAGSDYKEVETRGAWLALTAGGWMWGKNPVNDWRAALERQIQTDRKNNERGTKTNSGNNQRPDRSIGTLNEGVAAQYRGIKSRGLGGVATADPAAK